MEGRRLLQLFWYEPDLRRMYPQGPALRIIPQHTAQTRNQWTKIKGKQRLDSGTKESGSEAQSFKARTIYADTSQETSPSSERNYKYKCSVCGDSGGLRYMIRTGSYLLCPTCVGKIHRLEHESLEKRLRSGGAGSSTGICTCDYEAELLSTDVYVPESKGDAMFHATVHSKDQVPRLWTQYGSIQGIRYSSKKFKRIP